MTKLSQLIGHFQKKGSKLTRKDFLGFLQIGTRKQVTPTKPPKFLIYKTPDQEMYISSMYPLNEPIEAYKIEYGGQLARVEFTTPEKVVISPFNPVCENINYKLSQRS